MDRKGLFLKTLLLSLIFLGIVIFINSIFLRSKKEIQTEIKVLLVREIPASFPVGTHLPNIRETDVCGAIDPANFEPLKYLVYFYDPRVIWESDVDTNGEEDDHLIHRDMVERLVNLIELVTRRKGTLVVMDAYRPYGGGHTQNSLHREGRAIDLKSKGITLEELAKFCWAVGFDWVYLEGKSGVPTHVHCSIRSLKNNY